MPTFPGLNSPSGSIARFTNFIRLTVPSPSSSLRYLFFPIPTPCSPVPEIETLRQTSIKRVGENKERNVNKHVPSIAIARCARRCAAFCAISSSSSVVNSSMAWKFPSPTCPITVETKPTSSRSFLVSWMRSGSLDTGTLHVHNNNRQVRGSAKRHRDLDQNHSPNIRSHRPAPLQQRQL